MDIKIRKVDLDEFFKEMLKSDIFCNWIDENADKDDDEKDFGKAPGKFENRIERKKCDPKHDCSNEDMQLVASLRKSLGELKEKYDNVAEVASFAQERERILDDKIAADGYRILNDIKVWIEFARKCGKTESNGFMDMLDRMIQLLNGFAMSRKVC